MIIIEKITMRNFMSVGNSPIEIDYTKNKSTLVSATNGSGKSVLMTDSLVYALYGYPYRPINKPQLINSINGKGLLVEVEFKVNKTKYKVVRGMKPNVFEIYKNGTLLNQDAAARDYQKILETSILKMNHRTFTQVVIMGSGNYIPFMKLNPAQRREFIEDILDIKVFSTMNTLLKDRFKDVSDNIATVVGDIKLLTEKISMQEAFIKTLESEKETRIQELQQKVEHATTEINVDKMNITELMQKVEELDNTLVVMKSVPAKMTELKTLKQNISQSIEKNKQNRQFYSEIDVCPTCHQEVKDHHREKIVGSVDAKIDEYQKALDSILEKMAETSEQIAEYEKNQNELMHVQAQIGNLQSSITASMKLITNYQNQISSMQTNNASTDTERHKLKSMAKEVLTLSKKKAGLMEDQNYLDVASILLKDSGIKTKIIRQYIPVFNKLINSYLQQLDLFVSFNLDENFNETVKSRYRDAFTYESFSEGEKQRIDLALAFAFRTVARLKNAVDVNLLILDEVLDQSLDMNGIDLFFKLIDDLEKTNLFVISHREGVEDKFDRNIKLTKKNNFTVLS